MLTAMHPIDVECPTCGEPPEAVCRTSTGAKMTKFHSERFEATGQSPFSPFLRSARKASTSPVPYADARVTFIWNAGTRTSSTHLKFATTTEAKLGLLSGRERKVYVIWPGQTRTDIFLLDKPEYAREVLEGRAPLRWDDGVAEVALEDATWD